MTLKRAIAITVCILTLLPGYAIQKRRGQGPLVPEWVLPTDRDNPVLWSDAPQGLTKAAAPGSYATTKVDRTGEHEYLLILADFKDLHFSIQDNSALIKYYDRAFNEPGYVDYNTYQHRENVGGQIKTVTYNGVHGSVADYFESQSYGQYKPRFRVVGPVHLPQGYAHYGRNRNGMDISDSIHSFVHSICADPSIDSILAQYADNGNIAQLSIIYAGRGENYSGSDPNTIWPQADTINLNNRHGIKDIRFVCSCELFWDSDTILDGIGVFCHEFSHMLGLPDFYYTTNSTASETNAAMGTWSLMDYGAYDNGGFSPVGYTAFEKYCMGWLEIEDITEPGTYTLDEISQNPSGDRHVAYRLNSPDYNDDMFIILENHQQTGWYSYHAASGLMVTAVSYNSRNWANNSVTTTANKRYAILPADNNYSRSSNAGDLFPYNSTDSITTLGKPQLKAGTSFPLYSIYGIRNNNGIVSFQASADMPTHVHVQSACATNIKLEDGTLKITAPEGTMVWIHDMSGHTAYQTVMEGQEKTVPVPGHGIWLVKCGTVVRKIRY